MELTRTITRTVTVDTRETARRIVQLVDIRQKISAIKELRDATGARLLACKQAIHTIDQMRHRKGATFPTAVDAAEGLIIALHTQVRLGNEQP